MSEEKLFGDMLTALRMERLKAARGDGDEDEAKRWTQQGVADALEVSRATYSGWENGHHLPKPNERRAIAKLFRLSDEERDALYRAATQAPPIQEPPGIDNLPFQRNPFFTGRVTELEQIRKQLQEPGTATIIPPVSITGTGGIGKTELALEYAHRFYPDVYRTVLWANAADEGTLLASYAELAKTLKLPERDEQKLDLRIQAVKDWLRMYTNWLLIMDNADDLPLAESFLPSKPLGHVVFIARSQSIGTIATDSNHIEIEEMESDDGLLFLLLRSHKLKDRTKLNKVATDIRDTARELVKLLGGYPLALDQAGAYIEGTGMSFIDYVNRYHKERRRLLNRRRSPKSIDSEHSRHPLPVAATLNLSIKEACEGQPLASDILHFCAFLRPDAIPEKLFQYDESYKYDTTEFDEAIEALLSHSLIKRNSHKKTISLHQLVQAVVEDEMLPDVKKQWRARVLRTMCSIFPTVENQRDLLTFLPHAMMCTTWEEDNSAFILDVSYLSLAVGQSYQWHPEAESLLERSLAIRERYLGTDHPDTLLSLLHLACFHLFRLNYEQAELLFERALPLCERWWGLEYIYTDMCIHWLVFSYYEQRKYEQAVSVWQRVLSNREGRLGTDCFEVAITLHNLAELYAAIPGKLAESESCFLRATAILGDDYHYNGELARLVSLALREQSSGELTVAIQDKTREYASNSLMAGIYWGLWLELRLPDPKETIRSVLQYQRSIMRDAEADALEVND